ncbi:hypothetical protein L3Y34_012404 [Caenorhabditis briggsae]|uniref:Uncharacterized protein n=2 Tax=Caenorhabditis briggsae TaxID=6238 RepID=A0AAE8ZTZ9_CAEBR|nr:hypothetical protein L3Y34_012404 [Caenorhabditis briggsae]
MFGPEQIKEVEEAFGKNNPHPPAYYLKLLKQLFYELAPNATEEQKNRLETLSKSVIKYNVFIHKKLNENTDKTTGEHEKAVTEWRLRFEKIKKQAAKEKNKVYSYEDLEKVNTEMENMHTEIAFWDARSKKMKEELKKQEEDHKAKMLEDKRNYDAKVTKMTFEMSDLQMDLALKQIQT